MEKNVVKIYRQVRVVTDDCSEQLAFQLRPKRNEGTRQRVENQRTQAEKKT